MMLNFLGGCNEVGRAGFVASDRNSNLLLEYGVKLQPKIELPSVPTVKLDGVFISHAHLDHSGMAPLLYRLQNPKLYATSATMDLMHLLLEDYIKVGKLTRGFSEFTARDMDMMNRNFKRCSYNKQFRVGNLDCRIFPAYHIPGSASIHLRGAKSLLFTGDIAQSKTYLLGYHHINYPKTDCLMMETTYAAEDHPDREREEKRFIEKIKEYAGGIVLLPSFAVGRAQELLLMLHANGIKQDIYLDGMAQKAADIILYHKNELRDAHELKEAMKKAHFVKTKKQRAAICKKGGIVLTTSGMLSGGPICYYLRKVRDDSDACLLLTGYQAENTPGYGVLKTGYFENEEDGRYKVNLEVMKYDFSGHAGRSELFGLIKNVKPKTVVCVHGEHTKRFSEEVRDRFHIEAFAPRNGDVLEV
ncbi:MAG: MBL fold metallo-hydrolase [Candidatus Aenigmarchaeota archaeon]|nr:MBL fold metallo-hydrolase [Candidatus Aenigmarchaeota archaeon]